MNEDQLSDEIDKLMKNKDVVYKTLAGFNKETELEKIESESDEDEN